MDDTVLQAVPGRGLIRPFSHCPMGGFQGLFLKNSDLIPMAHLLLKMKCST